MKVVVFKRKDCSLYDYRVNVKEIKETIDSIIIYYDNYSLILSKNLFYFMVSIV